jgi:TonB-dependent receptor
MAQSIKLRLQKTTLAKVAASLQQQAPGSNFSYSPEVFEKVNIEQVQADAPSLQVMLDLLKKQIGLHSLVDGNNITLKYIPLKSLPASRQQPGKLTGKIIDEESGQPVPGATIQIGSNSTITDLNGAFSFPLSKGSYTATVSYVGYNTKEITEIDIQENHAFALTITLKRGQGNLAGVLVVSSARQESVAALYVKQKNNAAITDGISAEQIRQTPDNNTAQVLKRVSGLTVQDDKFVTVRGLSERYNNVQLNGSNLPSTEPNRKNFAFDIIPSSLISNIVINKTATPDQTAEFSGAIVQVNTIDVPDHDFLALSLGTGWNTNIKGRSILSTRRGSKDYLGYDDGRRTWMGNSFDRTEYATLYNGGKLQERAAYGARIPNNWGLYQYNYVPVQSYQLGGGKLVRFKNNTSLGFVAGASYRNEQTIEDFSRLNPSNFKVTDGQNYNFNTTWAVLANVTYQANRSKFSWKNTITRRFSNESEVYKGIDYNRSQNASDYFDIVLMNHLYNTRLDGEHSLSANSSWKIDWFGDYSKVTREQPDTRFSRAVRTDYQPEDYKSYNIGDGGSFTDGASLFSSLLTEKRYNAGAAVTKKIKIAGREQLVKTGYSYNRRKADFGSAGYRVKLNALVGNADKNEAITGNPDYIAFAPAHFQSGTLSYLPTGPMSSLINNAGEEYYGTQQLHAAYLMLDLRPINKVRLIGGVRMEQNKMEVTGAFYQNGTGSGMTLQFDETRFLPSVNAIYSFHKKMNLRFAYSQTLARPDFRERQDFRYYDFKEMTSFYGYTGLKDVTTNNIDLRYEWYPAAGEVVSLTGFHKRFVNPVEVVAFATSGNNSNMYFNMDNSTNTGIEADFRKSLHFVATRSTFFSNLFVHGNFTWMKSKVVYDRNRLGAQMSGQPYEGEATTTRQRPLQGLSPYVINGGISYTGKTAGFSVSYNRFGRRIRFAGLSADEDQYENPRDVVDIQLSARFLHQKMEVKLNISDLLNQRFIVYRNTKYEDNNTTIGDADSEKDQRYNKGKDLEWYGYQKGSNVGLSVSYRL